VAVVRHWANPDLVGLRRAIQLRLQGNQAMLQKNFPRAINTYTQAISALPADAPGLDVLLSNRAAAFLNWDRPQDALADAEAALKVNTALRSGVCARAATPNRPPPRSLSRVIS
jgi:tetratricopeptide (TPR) repeat protein